MNPTTPAPQFTTANTTFIASPPPGSSSQFRGRATLAKRGRKPRGLLPGFSQAPRPVESAPVASSSTLTNVQWPSTTTSPVFATAATTSTQPNTAASVATNPLTNSTTATTMNTTTTATTATTTTPTPMPTTTTTTTTTMPPFQFSGTSLLSLPGVTFTTPMTRFGPVDDDNDGEDELLPAMADDDYSAQLSWQSQSKDNLKVLMDNLNPEQYERFEAYRRHALPKQAVRKVIQQMLGQQVSQPVAQIVAGFAKVFVGEIVERARAVQRRRGDEGPLSPDHLREAYRMYQEQTGRVGAARPLRSRRLFVR